MIYTHEFNGVTAKTGDILFTRDGTANSVFGAIWKLFGHIINNNPSQGECIQL